MKLYYALSLCIHLVLLILVSKYQSPEIINIDFIQNHSENLLSGNWVVQRPHPVLAKNPVASNSDQPRNQVEKEFSQFEVGGFPDKLDDDFVVLGGSSKEDVKLANYASELQTYIHAQIGRLAKGSYLMGELEIEFKIHSSGIFYDVRIKKTSKHRDVDRRTTEIISKMAAFRPWPEGVSLQGMSFVIPVRFNEVVE